MSITKIDITKALSGVKDPNTGRSILATNMVRELSIEDNQVTFTLVLPNLSTTDKAKLHMACTEAIQQHKPEAQVHIHMMANAQQAQAGVTSTPQVKNVIAVASGKGGVGKSTVAVNLAYGLQKLGAKVGLIDADVYGPSIPTMLGLQDQRPKTEVLYGKPKIVPLEKDGLHVVSIGFIVDADQAVVLRGPRLAGIIQQFFAEVLWPDLDFIIVDLPPGTGDVQLTLVQTVPVTGVVMVTTPQEVAVADAIKAMNMFKLPSVGVPILGVVENMSWFTPEELPDNKYYLFGKGGGKSLVKASNSMLLGQVPLVQGIRESGDDGKPAILHQSEIVKDVYLKIAENTLRQVAVRNEQLAPTKKVDMQR